MAKYKQQGESRQQIVTPHAAMVIWNYVDRLSSWTPGGIKSSKDETARQYL
jgi:hypothetical protein